jgi:hypothetical protein
MKEIFALFCFLAVSTNSYCQSAGQVTVKKSDDFTVTGTGSAKNWNAAEWISIPSRSGPFANLETKVRILYSKKGMYFLFDCADNRLTSTMNSDFLDLWTEDVVEVFLWTDESAPVYFEYEISPMDYELPLLISNEKGDLLRWQPFHYESNRKTIHATAVRGGEKKSMATVSGWSAEFFIPYALLHPLNNNIPKSGTKWRANMYRVDYDDKKATSWNWQPVSGTFHDYKKFGTLVFE